MKKFFRRSLIIAIPLMVMLVMTFNVWAAADDSNTVSLLHFDGSNPVDEVTNKVWAIHDAINTQTVKKFGNSSMYFNGSSNLVANANSDFEFGGSDFTIDAWINPDQLTNYMQIYDKRNNPNLYRGVHIMIDANGQLLFWATSNNVSWDIAGASVMASGIKAGQWNHIAIVRKGSQIKGYVNGQSNGTTINSSQPIAQNTDDYVHIAGETTGCYFKGYIDEFRISKVARWDENFSVSTEAYGLPSKDDPTNPTTGNPTTTTPSNDLRTLTLAMNNGTVREFSLTEDKIATFLQWYDDRSNGISKAYYIIEVKDMNAKVRKEYILFDRIYTFFIKD